VTYFNVHFNEGTETKDGELVMVAGRDSNPVYPKYETGKLTSHPGISIFSTCSESVIRGMLIE
jgi:hypothetical protein